MFFFFLYAQHSLSDARTLRMSRSIAPHRFHNNHVETEAEYVRRMIHEEQAAVGGGFDIDFIRNVNTMEWYERAERFYQRAYEEFWSWGVYGPVENFTTFAVRDTAELAELARRYEHWADAPDSEVVDEVVDVPDSEVVEEVVEEVDDGRDMHPKLPKDLLVPDWCGDCDWACSICLEDNPELSRVKTACGHEFHKACLDGLKKTQVNAWFTTYIHSGPWEEGLPERMDFDTAAAAQSREWHHEPNPVIEDGYVLANRTWNVPCPLCRTKIALDDGESKREFDAWSTCRCCERHLTRRPPSYAPWRMPPERAPRRPMNECECECVCRSRSRELAFQLW